MSLSSSTRQLSPVRSTTSVPAALRCWRVATLPSTCTSRSHEHDRSAPGTGPAAPRPPRPRLRARARARPYDEREVHQAMNPIDFTFSDTIAGYVTAADPNHGTFSLKTPGGTEFQAKLTTATFAEFVRNLGEPYADATGQVKELLTPGQYVF